MSELAIKLMLVALLLTMVNFIYQAVTNQLWAVALERSVFQVTAILCVGIMLY